MFVDQGFFVKVFIYQVIAVYDPNDLLSIFALDQKQ